MIKKLLFLLFVSTCCSGYAQVIQDPVRDLAKPGRTYVKWVVDINHDGINDVLIDVKPTPDEIKDNEAVARELFNPDEYGFGVYLGIKGGGYLKVERTYGPGSMQFGIMVDISQCYVGYIEEIKQYGIVTAGLRKVQDPDIPEAKHGVIEKQVYCYTVEGDHMKRTNLTPLLIPDEKNAIYDKYLSEAKRTKVQLQEIKP
jgi:hypothetical protein